MGSSLGRLPKRGDPYPDPPGLERDTRYLDPRIVKSVTADNPIRAETELKGGRVNYYLVHVSHPQREDQPPYTAECEDIGDALELTPDEMNIFKEIWRSANARKGNGKPDHKALYGAEKIVHYANRILKKLLRKA